MTDKKNRLRRRALPVMIATLFLHACTTLEQQPAETGQTATTSSESTGNRIRRQRTESLSRPAQTPTEPTIELSDEEIAFQQSVWYRISEGLTFYHQYYNDQIQDEIDWFEGHPQLMEQVSERAAPFIYEIVNEIEKRGLPMELALLPVIESAYRPEAKSHVNAAGLWQFMGATARGLGLKRDWWYDGRHDPIASTSAALDYLEALHQQFNEDWLLALAAYNAGQGTISRAIRRNENQGKATDFWSLRIPGETQQHVPRLLALSYLMADPLGNEIKIAMTPDEPAIARVDAGGQIDLTLAAELAGIDTDTLYALNPGYLQWATSPLGPHWINLPVDQADLFESALAELGDQRTTWERYTIQPGDTLGNIAQQFRTQVSVLQQTNNLNCSMIRAGDTLLIPRAYRAGDPMPTALAGMTEQQQDRRYTVQSGDTLWRISRQFRVSVDDLMSWNQLQSDDVIRPGQQILIRSQVLTATISGEPESSTLQYRVRPGDSLSRIASEHNVSVRELVLWNSISERSTIYPGQELQIQRNH